MATSPVSIVFMNGARTVSALGDIVAYGWCLWELIHSAFASKA
jgi:hypothetical protein